MKFITNFVGANAASASLAFQSPAVLGVDNQRKVRDDTLLAQATATLAGL